MAVDASRENVAYLVFDVEAVADGELVAAVRYPEAGLSPGEAVRRYRDELREQKGSDVLPPTFMLPVSVAVAKVTAEYRLLDLTVLDEPPVRRGSPDPAEPQTEGLNRLSGRPAVDQGAGSGDPRTTGYRPHVMAGKFWQGWRHYRRPTLVTFNGRGYDLPVLELAAFRYGLSLPDWFNVDARSYEQSRNRYNTSAHIDLMDLFSNFGAMRVVGGLNLLANLIGKPGKTGIDGSHIQDMYDAGRIEEINDYCRCDVLDTYFVFLRSRVLLGKLPLDEEQALVLETKQWLAERAESSPAFAHYLKHWGDWEPPGE